MIAAAELITQQQGVWSRKRFHVKCKHVRDYKMSLTTLTVTSCGFLTVTVNGLPLNNLLIGVDDPGEVIAGLQDVT